MLNICQGTDSANLQVCLGEPFCESGDKRRQIFWAFASKISNFNACNQRIWWASASGWLVTMWQGGDGPATKRPQIHLHNKYISLQLRVCSKIVQIWHVHTGYIMNLWQPNKKWSWPAMAAAAATVYQWYVTGCMLCICVFVFFLTLWKCTSFV